MKNDATTTPAKPSAPATVAADSYAIRDGAVVLYNPRIDLHGDVMFTEGDVRTLTRKWRPKEALIVGGLVIIEEWGVVVPLSYLHVGYIGEQKTYPRTTS